MSNSRIIIATLALSAAACGAVLGAAETENWTVPATPTSIVAEFTGFVEADRSKLTQIFPPGQRLVVSWVAMTGRAVVPGEMVLAFDTQLVERDLPQRRAELDEAEAQYRVSLLKLDGDRAGLMAQAAQARADLATARAQLAALGTDDEADTALARTRADQARDEVARATRELVRVQARATAGDASVQQVADAQQVVTLAALDAQRAQAAALRTAQRDRSIERGRLLLDERRLLGQLGVVRAATGSESEDPQQGLAARVAQNQAARASQEANLAAERDARRTTWHEVERDLHDHCPLTTVELVPVAVAAGAKELRWDFAPAGTTVANGWRLDDGTAFTTTRGWGWDRDLGPRMRLAPAPAPAQAPAPAAGVTPEAVPPRPDSWCLVREPAVWTAQVPDGTWTLRLGLGADAEWDGAVVRVDGGLGPQLAYVANRIDANAFPTVEVPVTVRGGQLRLLVGDQPGKHVYAITAGVLTLHPRTERGRKSDWVTRPLAFIATPAAVRINARAPAAMAPLLKTVDAPAGDDLRSRSATSAVTIEPPGQPAIRGIVTQVGTKPVGIRLGPTGWNEEDQGLPQDLTHREVLITVAPADAQRLVLRSQVVVRVSAIPPAGVTAVPPWMVTWRASVAWLLDAAGGWRQVEAVRAGPCTLVAGLLPGTVLRPPLGEPPAPAVTTPAEPTVGSTVLDGGFPGEVVAGARVRVTMPGGWGRVATNIADGSEVKPGDELLTLYNPVIEQQKNELARARREAERNFASEVAARRERLLAAADQRRNNEITEASARFTLAEARQLDATLPENVIAAQRSVRSAARTAELATATAALAAPPAADLAQRQSAAARAATLAARADLAVAQSANSHDWATSADAEAAWKVALQALGQREADDVVARGEDRVAAAKAAAALAAMDQGQDWVNDFERNKVLKATAAGRLYWLLAWNDQTRTRGKLTKDVWVWGGMPVAEIVDMGKLSFTAELPETLYPRMRKGLVMQIRFPVLGDRRFSAAVSEVGQALGPSRDAASAARDERITDHRVFTLTLDLDLQTAAGADGRGGVQPGLRGILEYP